jgi:hypothetical protein
MQLGALAKVAGNMKSGMHRPEKSSCRTFTQEKEKIIKPLIDSLPKSTKAVKSVSQICIMYTNIDVLV